MIDTLSIRRLLVLCLVVTSCGAVGCSSSRYQTPAATEGAVFPHPEGYAEAGSGTHGSDSLEAGIAVCQACHALEGVAEDVTPPTCTSCHVGYPHVEGWRDGVTHGAGILAVPESIEDCSGCHGSGPEGGPAGVACQDCHSTYPHADGWEQAGAHGLLVVERGGTATCASACHGVDLDGGDSQVTCWECHDNYPHASGWNGGPIHGAEATPPSTCATDCHGSGYTGGNSGVSCFQCHGNFPHAVGWADDHLQVVVQLGEAGCMACHEPGDGPSTVIASCATSCHGGAP